MPKEPAGSILIFFDLKYPFIYQLRLLEIYKYVQVELNAGFFPCKVNLELVAKT